MHMHFTAGGPDDVRLELDGVDITKAVLARGFQITLAGPARQPLVSMIVRPDRLTVEGDAALSVAVETHQSVLDALISATSDQIEATTAQVRETERAIDLLSQQIKSGAEEGLAKLQPQLDKVHAAIAALPHRVVTDPDEPTDTTT